jgi:hypothetical protein
MLMAIPVPVLPFVKQKGIRQHAPKSNPTALFTATF